MRVLLACLQTWCPALCCSHRLVLIVIGLEAAFCCMYHSFKAMKFPGLLSVPSALQGTINSLIGEWLCSYWSLVQLAAIY